MKIAFVSAWTSRTGAGVFTAESQLASALVEEGMQVHKFGPHDEHSQADRGRWRGVNVLGFPVRGPSTFCFMPGLNAALTELRPDILHTHGVWTYASVASRRVAKKLHIPMIISPHGMLDRPRLMHKGFKKSLALLTYENSNFTAAAQFHALTGAEKESIESLGYMGKTTVIPNGINLPLLQLKPDSDRYTVTYVGRINVLKGIDMLLDAWARFKSQANQSFEWELRIVGYGDPPSYEREVQSLINTPGVKETVTFVGPKYGPELEIEYRSANVVVLPSKTEGFPMSILEAWSFGLPTIYTTACNLPIGESARAAIIVKPTSGDILAGLLRYYETDEKTRAAMGVAARKLAETFSWPRIAREFIEMYHNQINLIAR